MNYSIPSKLDKTAFYLQVLVVVCPWIAFLLDPSFLFFGAYFSTPLSLAILLYLIARCIYQYPRPSKVALRGLILSLVWLVLSWTLMVLAFKASYFMGSRMG
jgi:hypothetical protein